MKPKEIRKLREGCKRQKFVGARIEESYDDEKFAGLLRDACVLDWKNITSDGEALACTPENREILDDNWSEFRLFWNHIVTTGAAAESYLVEQERKNLPNGESSS